MVVWFAALLMSEAEKQNDDRWDQVMSGLDLLFARVSEIGSAQQQLCDQVDLIAQAVDQFGKQKQFLSKQVDAKGQAIVSF